MYITCTVSEKSRNYWLHNFSTNVPISHNTYSCIIAFMMNYNIDLPQGALHVYILQNIYSANVFLDFQHNEMKNTTNQIFRLAHIPNQWYKKTMHYGDILVLSKKMHLVILFYGIVYKKTTNTFYTISVISMIDVFYEYIQLE